MLRLLTTAIRCPVDCCRSWTACAAKRVKRLPATELQRQESGTGIRRFDCELLSRHVVTEWSVNTKKKRTKYRGDISGLRHMGERIVVEAKDYGGRIEVGTSAKPRLEENGATMTRPSV